MFCALSAEFATIFFYLENAESGGIGAETPQIFREHSETVRIHTDANVYDTADIVIKWPEKRLWKCPSAEYSIDVGSYSPSH